MTRPLRIEYPGAWYHVMNRGRRREAIYFGRDDYKSFLKILEQTCKLFYFEIHAYTLIRNHYHLLIRTPKGNLSRGMRHINGVYTQKFNKRHKIDGSLFRGRYKAILVEEDSYLLELVRYIHRNPLKANLEEKIGQYEWCSHKGYMKESQRESFLQIDTVLKKFGEYEKEAKREMRVFVEKEVPKKLLKRLDNVNWPAMLGGKEFKEKIKETIRGRKLEAREITGYRENACEKEKDADKIKRILESKQVVRNKARNRKSAEERRTIIYLLRCYGMSLKEIGKCMGGISYVAVSRQFKIAEESIKNKSVCYKKLKEIREELKLQV
jgi:putative transposase